MSETPYGEDAKKEVILDSKDAEIVEKFFQHFNLSIPEHLREAIDAFNKDANIDTQEKFKLALTSSVKMLKDDFVKIDEIFEPVVMACDETSYNLQFDKDFHKVLSEESEEQKPEDN